MSKNESKAVREYQELEKRKASNEEIKSFLGRLDYMGLQEVSLYISHQIDEALKEDTRRLLNEEN